MSRLKIGCHLSSSAGYVNMAKEAISIGACTFQFFTRNPRGGQAKAIRPEDVAEYMKIAAEHEFCPIIAHAPYTLNPCAAEERIRNFTREIMLDDIARMELTPGNFYNFHPGSHVGQGVEKGVELIADILNDILQKGLSTTILLETMSGKGSEIGGKFQELRWIIDEVRDSSTLGVCLDTCHVNDGGYDIVNDLDGVLNEFDEIIGLERLKAIHLNDSKNPFASHKDRHEKLGDGTLGIDAIASIVNHPKLRDLPFILETPNELDGYGQEIARLKSLYNVSQ